MTHTIPSSSFSGAQPTSGARPVRQLLVVDDDPSVRHALWITFRDFYDVILAEDGDKALQAFAKNPADVAIVDVRMPGISGLDVLKRLKELDPAVEVLLLTAYENVDYVREALRLDPALNAAAVEAVKQWEFAPTLLDDMPTAVIMSVTVNFSIAGN